MDRAQSSCTIGEWIDDVFFAFSLEAMGSLTRGKYGMHGSGGFTSSINTQNFSAVSFLLGKIPSAVGVSDIAT